MNQATYRGLVLVAVVLVLAASFAFADDFLADFYGYDYWSPWTAPSGAPGDCYNSVGYTPAVNPVFLTFDYAVNEYTYSLQSVCLSTVDTVGTHVILEFTGGTLDLYCDPLTGGTTADFGTNPPNAVSPSTFEDGDCVLGADLATMQIVIDTTTGNADLFGSLDFVRGSQLGNLPANQRNGWTLAGLRAAAPGIPAGYSWQVDGQLFLQAPVPVQDESWGSIKSRFQGGESR